MRAPSTKTQAKGSAKAKKKARRSVSVDADVGLDPATKSFSARVAGCNKPPVKYLKQSDGSWLECFLRPDCTYGNCHFVDKSEVPSAIRNK
jgi:hypothetical protein